MKKISINFSPNLKISQPNHILIIYNLSTMDTPKLRTQREQRPKQYDTIMCHHLGHCFDQNERQFDLTILTMPGNEWTFTSR